MGISLYTSRVILQQLGFEDFGLYNVVGGIVSMFTFLNDSLAGATSRYLTFELGKQDYDRLKKIFNVALLCHFFIALLIVVLAETVGLWFLYEKMVIPEDRFTAAMVVYQISILTSVLSITQVPYNATIIAHENMKVYAYVGMAVAIANLTITFLLMISPIDKLIFYAVLLCAVQFSAMMYYRYYCISHYPESHFKIYRDKGLYKEIFGYAGASLIGNISVLAQGQGLNLLLNLFFGPVVNAARAIAYQVQGAITQFSGNFITAVKPQIVKSYATGDLSGMMTLVVTSSWMSYYLMWLIALPLCLEAPYVLSLWLGKYPAHTLSFLMLIIILCLIQTIKSPRIVVFHATGHLKLNNAVVGSILCAAFPLAYLFLKLGMPAESVFIAANISVATSEIASIIILKRYINYSILNYLKQVYGRCLLVTASSMIIPLALYDRWLEPSFLRLILTCILTTLSIGCTAFMFGTDRQTRRKLLDFIQSRRPHLR